MTKNVIILITLFLSIASVIFHPSSAIALEDNDYSIKNVINGIDTLRSYHVNLNTKIFPPNKSDLDPNAPHEFDPNRFMEIKSTVFGESGKKMKLVTIMPMPETDVDIEITLNFDGTWLWVQNKTTEHPQMISSQPKFEIMKIHIPSVSPDPVNEPFKTFFGISGTGLYREQDLPGTFSEILKNYDLKNTTSVKNTNKNIFKGHRKNDLKLPELELVDSKLRELMDKTTQFCTLWVSKETGLIMAYSIGQSYERPSFHTEIDYLSVNEELSKDTFKYIPPEGVLVKDITSTILEQKKILKEKMGE